MKVDPGYMQAETAKHAALRDFFAFRKVEYDAFFKGKDQSEANWNAMQDRVEAEYKSLAGRMEKLQRAQYDYLMALSAFNNKAHGKALRQLFDRMVKFNREDMQSVET